MMIEVSCSLFILFQSFHLIHAINPMGNLRRNIHETDYIDELPFTEGYDASTGYISHPSQVCTKLQNDYSVHCEGIRELDEKKDEMTMEKECDSRRDAWMSKCVFGDEKVGLL